MVVNHTQFDTRQKDTAPEFQMVQGTLVPTMGWLSIPAGVYAGDQLAGFAGQGVRTGAYTCPYTCTHTNPVCKRDTAAASLYVLHSSFCNINKQQHKLLSDVHPRLHHWRASVTDSGPALLQHWVNPLPAKLFNWNFHPLEVVSR